MKKNTLLYILVLFLVVINGFFLFKIFGDSRPPDRNPGQFIAKELNFDEAQMQDFRDINMEHNEAIREISREVRQLKDALFNQLSEAVVNEEKVNDLTRRIGEKARQKDLKTFYHFKAVQEICTEEQRKRFISIIKDALHRPRKRRRK
jgi:Spy/CpxP family protein refolding chaperone